MASYRPRRRHRAQEHSVPAPREIPDRPAAGPPGRGNSARLAMLCYLGVPFLGFLAPLACYLASRHAPEVRWHAVQALNLWFTAALYTVCALIIGGILALDALGVALIIVTPLAVALWLIALRFLIRAAAAADRGDRYEIPSWLCATVFRQNSRAPASPPAQVSR
jgi:uncharacterized Tic20 family protein